MYNTWCFAQNSESRSWDYKGKIIHTLEDRLIPGFDSIVFPNEYILYGEKGTKE